MMVFIIVWYILACFIFGMSLTIFGLVWAVALIDVLTSHKKKHDTPGE